MLSRVAENIYWLGRYVERSENLARLVNVNGYLLLDLPSSQGITTGSPDWRSLLYTTGSEESYLEKYDDFSFINILNHLVFDQSYGGSIISSLAYARWNARTVREIMPNDSWKVINGLYNNCLEASKELLNLNNTRLRQGFLQEIIEKCQLYRGCLGSTLNHDTANDFFYSGIYVERADMTSRSVEPLSLTYLDRSKDEDADDLNVHLISLLRSFSAYQMYRQSVQRDIALDEVISFLMLYPTFPRSILFCVNQIKALALKLPDHSDKDTADFRNQINNKAEEIATLLNTVGTETIDKEMDRVQTLLGDLHNIIAAQYF